MMVRYPNSKDHRRSSVIDPRDRLNSNFEANDETHADPFSLSVDPVENGHGNNYAGKRASNRSPSLSISPLLFRISMTHSKWKGNSPRATRLSADLQLYTTLGTVIVVGSTI